MRKWKLDELPDNVRKQVMKQLGKTEMPVEQTTEKASIRENKRKPNKTEELYQRIELAGGGIFEGVTLRLPGGSRYTPDFVTFDGMRIIVHEVKGSYRLQSQGRAVTAFKECVAAFPQIGFVWAQKDGNRFRKTVFNVIDNTACQQTEEVLT